MFSPTLFIAHFCTLLGFFLHSFNLIFDLWHQVWTQNDISVLCIPTHSLYPYNALAIYTTDFAWEFKLKTESHNVKLCTLPTSNILTLHLSAELLPIQWKMQFMLQPSSLFSGYTVSTVCCCFCPFCATTDGFSFPIQQQDYPELEMDF